MKYFLVISLVTIFACTNHPKKQTDINELTNQQDSKKTDSTEVVKIVSDFFKAFDERNLEALDTILAPTSKIIHHNGVTTTKEEMITIVKETKNWVPRQRLLSNYEFIVDCNLAVASLTNEVTFLMPEDKTIVDKYIETWTFKKIKTAWKPIRITYSKVIADKHSEEAD